MKTLKLILEGLLSTTGADINPDDYTPVIRRFPERFQVYKMPNEDTGVWPIVIERTDRTQTFEPLVADLLDKEALKYTKIKKLKQESIYKLKEGRVYITMIKGVRGEWVRIIFSYYYATNDIIPLAKEVLLNEDGALAVKAGQLYDPSGFKYQRFDCPMELFERIMKKLNITNWN